MNLLRVEHISTGYGKRQVLFDISFEIKKGETVLLIGSNGSGKSTLLKVIYGLLKPWDKDGKIWFNNEDITAFKPSPLIRKGIVYIPQQNELFEDLTVKENLEISGMQTAKNIKPNGRIDEVTEQMPALKTLLKRKCNRLSGGERKLLSLSMALMNEPSLIMLDEPLAGINPKGTSTIIHKLEILQGLGLSFILVEHRLKDVFKLADKTVGLRLGKLYNENINSLENTKEVML